MDNLRVNLFSVNFPICYKISLYFPKFIQNLVQLKHVFKFGKKIFFPGYLFKKKLETNRNFVKALTGK